MDVSVLTSLSEGLSITLLESMNFALPTVATRVGGNPELVIHGQTGFLVPPNNPREFAARVVDVLRDAALRFQFGRAGRRRVETNFQLADCARRYAATYDTISQRQPVG